MWAKYKYHLLVGLTVIALWMAEVNKPQAVNWTESYSNKSGIPYGCKVLFNELPSLFHGQIAVWDSLNDMSPKDDFDGNILIINRDFNLSKPVLDEFLDYIHQGNTGFIAASDISANLLDTLGVAIDQNVSVAAGDSMTLCVEGNDSTFYCANKTVEIVSVFTLKDTVNATIIGQWNDTLVNCVRIPFGQGQIFLHCQPSLFTNYGMLHRNGHRYVSAVLSHIPDGNIVWDENFKAFKSASRQQSPMIAILQTDGLRQALYVMLIGLLIYMVFAIKRRQRIIPVNEEKVNTAIDFTRTIGRLYFNTGNNHNIGVKQTDYFLAHIRNRYSIPTVKLDDEFCDKLHKHSQVPLAEIKDLVRLINFVRAVKDTSNEKIVQLDRAIDDFYDKTNGNG